MFACYASNGLKFMLATALLGSFGSRYNYLRPKLGWNNTFFRSTFFLNYCMNVWSQAQDLEYRIFWTLSQSIGVNVWSSNFKLSPVYYAVAFPELNHHDVKVLSFVNTRMAAETTNKRTLHKQLWRRCVGKKRTAPARTSFRNNTFS